MYNINVGDVLFKDDFQSILLSLKTLMFINIINGSLDGMQIDVIHQEPHTLSLEPSKSFSNSFIDFYSCEGFHQMIYQKE